MLDFFDLSGENIPCFRSCGSVWDLSMSNICSENRKPDHFPKMNPLRFLTFYYPRHFILLRLFLPNVFETIYSLSLTPRKHKKKTCTIFSLKWPFIYNWKNYMILSLRLIVYLLDLSLYKWSPKIAGWSWPLFDRPLVAGATPIFISGLLTEIVNALNRMKAECWVGWTFNYVRYLKAWSCCGVHQILF